MFGAGSFPTMVRFVLRSFSNFVLYTMDKVQKNSFTYQNV